MRSSNTPTEGLASQAVISKDKSDTSPLHMDLFMDSHGKDLENCIKDQANINSNVHLKPGKTFNVVVSDISNSTSDRILIWAGANDIYNKQATTFISSILTILRKLDEKGKQVYLVNIPRRFDLPKNSDINLKIRETNWILYELSLTYRNLVIIRTDNIKLIYYSKDKFHLSLVRQTDCSQKSSQESEPAS